MRTACTILLFADMRKAVEESNALFLQGKIIIYGDYDADGITGSVIASSVFRELGFVEGESYDVYLPDREKEGYGLNRAAVESLAQQGAKVLITVDCGITSIPEVDYANELGIDVIITDHHSIPEILPKAHAIMNARLPQETYPYKYLCGAGTVYKFMQALMRDLAKDGNLPTHVNREAVEKWLLDVVAIGTVADMVPHFENRLIVKYGLIVLENPVVLD